MASRKTPKKKSAGNRSGRPGARPVVARGAAAPAPVRPARLGDWIRAARPATLGLAIAPVLLGWGLGILQFQFADLDPWGLLPLSVVTLCFALSLTLQLGVNFANDYSDGIRGTDAHRVGPARLTASGAAPAKRVRLVAFVFFGIATLAGLGLTVLTEIRWLPAVGAVALLAAWFYTGGKRPYGYFGLGELVVFVFFGLVATTGTAFLLAEAIWLDSILAGIAMGLFAVAVLFINNMRDRSTDIEAGKRTLATRMPVWLSRLLFSLFMIGPFVILVYFSLVLFTAGWALFALFIVAPAILITWTATKPSEYVLVLKLTVWASLAYATILAWALAF
ncbi:MAG: 1,4-dihydroxy-2-naphthoate polyprenyltransferase [Microbacteriaceae bacterium]|nr:1,4-dihydroxy-2-naphthoate polyprenyltransferase [Microbacteriaceae bacterium]